MVVRRFYYSDSLAAAWMAKHFGMRFQNAMYGNGGAEMRDIAENDMATYAAAKIVYDQDFRLRIHPDSLPSLEPQQGDILHGGDLLGKKGLRVLATADPEDIRDAKVLMERGMVIIQRDGKPFFWPECEE